ncbi:23S rRNA (uracil(1939)-C(5))-methyltransferase RlmD [Fervidibacillus albus]|uniref:23S rRNA (Uracil(1939)-C(5))-methyltransferase RlmD n=1 Tax=Fervidibacillus albus TaxID=2980026 RepID=A0A9E8LT75_9BACI|nr:23S rRNA (uracil(1939)-C(5))-methyltransferase RlmD [Fervidibacillus albus]WAA09175.1 23S rRNA (uracil(1939)-C(5))-methyltransferase RlmD [Fervidibacillus albus]
MTENLPVKKNDYVDIHFEDYTHDGMGVGKIDGYPIFVEKALVGEHAKIKIVKVKKSYGYGKLIELYKKSPFRREIPKEEEHKYGGCQIQHMTYEGQLKFKENYVRQVLKKIGKLEDVHIRPIIGMDNPEHYRNKAQMPVGDKNGKLITGFYRPRSHEIVDTDESIIHLQKINEAVKVVKEVASTLGIPAYDEKAHKGVLRHIYARYGRETGELMVVLVTRTEQIPKKKQLVTELTRRLPQLKSLIQNMNPKRTNVILGEKTKVLWGRENIYDYIGNVKFAISAKSFFQVNPVQTKVLYEKALEYANLSGKETVIDAYCGIGTISLFLAQKAKNVYGVEVVGDAIEDARRNAELNEMTNVEFAVGKAEEVIPKWAEEGIQADVIVVDPPRKGCDEKLIQTMLEMKPARIVYVSCNPSTLARDLHMLESGGYRTIEVQPVDMFPYTSHVECCALLIKK